MKAISDTEINASKTEIPIFFACDGRYLPYLAVSILSIDEHATEEHSYRVRVLCEGIDSEMSAPIRNMPLKHTSVEFIDVTHLIDGVRQRLTATLRDYYSESIFYRIFIPSMFPELTRAIYLDCDLVLTDDIAKLYREDIGKSILGAVADESVAATPEFVRYVEEVIGISAQEYFNSGVLLINCTAFRRARIMERILSLTAKYGFRTVAPDQDYLNFLCHGRVHYLERGWNKQPIKTHGFDNNNLHLVHYNHFKKPWRYSGILYAQRFWQTAERTPYAEALRAGLKSYTDEQRARDAGGAMALLEGAEAIRKARCSFAAVITKKENRQGRQRKAI